MGKEVIPLKEISSLSMSEKNIIKTVGSPAFLLSNAIKVGCDTLPGFVITSDAFWSYTENGSRKLSESLWQDVLKQVSEIGQSCGKEFGGETPLLLALNSTGPERPTINIGLNDFTARRLESQTKNRGFVWDAYRRLIRSYGVLVHHIHESEFDDLFVGYRLSRNLMTIKQFQALDYIQITKLFKSVIVRHTGKPFPQDPFEQLRTLILASFDIYSSEFSASYRGSSHSDPHSGISLLFTQMCFGCINSSSGSAVLASHDYESGESKINGHFATQTFLDDLTDELVDFVSIDSVESPFQEHIRNMKDKLVLSVKELKDPVCMKWIIDDGVSHLISVERMRFQSLARLHAVREMVSSGIVTKEEAISRIHPGAVASLLTPHIKTKPKASFASGVGASFGTVSGVLTIDKEEAIRLSLNCESKAILVCPTLSILDLTAVSSSIGVVVLEGGHFSYAANILRAMSKPAAIGCKNLIIDRDNCSIDSGTMSCLLGEIVTVDTGDVFQTPIPTSPVDCIEGEDASEVMKWIDDIRSDKLNVYTTVSSLEEIKTSFAAGADGIGLLSLEILLSDNIESVCRFCSDKSREDLSPEIESRLASHCSDVFVAAGSRPVSVMFVDSPFKFLPSLEELVEEVTILDTHKEYDSHFDKEEELQTKTNLLELVRTVHESNPMMGVRGSRLNLMTKGLISLQCRGVISGVQNAKRRGADPHVRILLPDINDWHETMRMRREIEQQFEEMLEGRKLEIGSVIESPRGCMTSDFIAEHSDFIEFNTDGLHELTFGMCQHDAEPSFLRPYLEWGVISVSPFQSLDQDGAGELMRLGIEGMKKVKSDFSIGMYGHNCVDESSVNFCFGLGVNSITCSPDMVPVARLSAAQVVIASSSSSSQ